MPNLWAMDVKRLLAGGAAVLAIVSFFAGNPALLLAFAVILLAIAVVADA